MTPSPAARYGRVLADLFFPDTGCAICGRSLPGGWEPEICGACLEDIFGARADFRAFSSPSARFLDGVAFAGAYGGALEKAIIRLKNDPDRRLARCLGRLAAEALAAEQEWAGPGATPWAGPGATPWAGPGATPWAAVPRSGPPPVPIVVIPVPLHRERLRERGYNQAALLAQGVAEWLAEPAQVRDDIVERVRATPIQSSLSREERLLSVVGAFRVKAALPGAGVLVVDDVLTTGATAGELARVLKTAGAKLVWAAAAARA